MSPGRLALLLSLLTPLSATAQEADENTVTVPRLGMEAFRYLLHKRGIQPVKSTYDLTSNPSNKIIILLGPDSIRERLTDEVYNAMARGAALLIATDRGTVRTNLNKLELYITGEDVDADLDDCYQRRPKYPFVRPIRSFQKQDPGSLRLLFDDLEGDGSRALATNYPSVLRFHRQSGFLRAQPLAGYPFSTTLSSRREFDPQNDLFAAGGEINEGRYLVLADHSIFVNRMVLKTDNANLDFTEKCITWLQGDGKRSECLFIEDGEIKSEFDLPFPRDNGLDKFLKAMLLSEKHGDAVIADLEERDFFNRLLLLQFPLRQIIRVLLVVITTAILILGLFRLIGNRTRTDPARYLVTPDLAALIPRGNALQQRFEGMIDSGNVHEAARRLVIDFFAGLGAEPGAEGRPPTIVIEDGYKEAASLRRNVERLWQIGYGSVPLKIKPDDWTNLTRDLKKALEDADEGWWKFVPQPSDR